MVLFWLIPLDKVFNSNEAVVIKSSGFKVIIKSLPGVPSPTPAPNELELKTIVVPKPKPRVAEPLTIVIDETLVVPAVKVIDADISLLTEPVTIVVSEPPEAEGCWVIEFNKESCPKFIVPLIAPF